MVEQVGGTHYKGRYKHWDWCPEVNLGYLEGNATKYLARWYDKGGLEDLEKSCSYMEQTRNLHNKIGYQNECHLVTKAGGEYRLAVRNTALYFNEASLAPIEAYLSRLCAEWVSDKDLDHVIDLLKTNISAVGAQLSTGGNVGPLHTIEGTTDGAGAVPDASAHKVAAARASMGMAEPFGYQGDE
jgi:hypothetical protein